MFGYLVTWFKNIFILNPDIIACEVTRTIVEILRYWIQVKYENGNF